MLNGFALLCACTSRQNMFSAFKLEVCTSKLQPTMATAGDALALVGIMEEGQPYMKSRASEYEILDCEWTPSSLLGPQTEF